MSQPFEPGELRDLEGVEPTPAELADVAAVARGIERLARIEGVHPSASFADEVMRAVATEPLPQPAVAAGMAARRGRFGAMIAALAGSWRVVTSGDRPLAVRAQALAFVLVAVVAVGSIGGVAAVGAWQLLAPGPTPSVVPAPYVESSPPSSPSPSPSTTPSPSPTTSPQPTASPDPTETPDEGTPEPSGTDDHGGSGSGSGSSRTPDPTHRSTPEPSNTPHESETPEPSETPDH